MEAEIGVNEKIHSKDKNKRSPNLRKWFKFLNSNISSYSGIVLSRRM